MKATCIITLAPSIKQGYHFTEQGTEELELVKELSSTKAHYRELENKLIDAISNHWSNVEFITRSELIQTKQWITEIYSRLHLCAPERW